MNSMNGEQIKQIEQIEMNENVKTVEIPQQDSQNCEERVDERPVDQDRLHPCPACEYCTRERIPDRCTCFRQCYKYRSWLARTWHAVIAPFLRGDDERRRVKI